MKIGIITFWDSSDNYGQIMQCFALQHYLRLQGHRPFLIRFSPAPHRDGRLKRLARILRPSHVISYIAYRRALRAGAAFDAKHPRAFGAFRERHLVLSERIYRSLEELRRERWDADALICGSDQIWSPSPNIDSYFLRFAPITMPKIAYATSFGRSVLPEPYAARLTSLLKEFRAVGLRETEGATLCREAGYARAELVCDPTLLLDRAYYLRTILGKEQVATGDHGFFYLINWPTQIPLDEIRRHAAQHGQPIRFFPAHGLELDGTEPYGDLTIESWLESIASARWVVTNSFHGTVLAILQHRPFVTLPLCGSSESMNGRIRTLLERLGLADRMYTGERPIDELLTSPIDWDETDRLLAEFRASSERFLADALTERRPDEPTAPTVCFRSNGGINHDFGGLDRVTELLADYFASRGCKVYYLSHTRRPGTSNDRQYYLPDAARVRTPANIAYFNDFVRSKKVDLLIDQEGNVDNRLPLAPDLTHIVRLTVLHFNPNYITENHFRHKFTTASRLPRPIRRVCAALFELAPVRRRGLKLLRDRLVRNYIAQCNDCDQFVMLSDRFRRELSALFGERPLPENICAINNPATFAFREIDFAKKKKRLLYVGRLERNQKRVDLIVEVWKKLAAEFPDWELDIVGGGPDEEALKRQAQHIRGVRFHGIRNPAPFYEEASVCCFASSAIEGWGMVLVEAQAMGCVPIAFDTYSALHDIIEDEATGCLVANDDLQEYALRLARLMRDEPLRRAMAERSIRAAERFRLDLIGEQWLTLFDTIRRTKDTRS